MANEVMELDVQHNVDMTVSGSTTDLYAFLKDYNTVVLQPNRVGNKNILTQDMVSDSNVKYIIKYNYDLNGQIMVLNENTIIEIDGGSLQNGYLTGNNSLLIDRNQLGEKNILISVGKRGTWKQSYEDRIAALEALAAQAQNNL